MQAPSTSEASYLKIIHQYNTRDIDQSELSFALECSSDNFGNEIKQTERQYISDVEAVLPSTYTTSSITVTSMPDIKAGLYKLRIDGTGGTGSGALDINYKLDYDSVKPSSVGTGGGVEITFAGTGFSDTTKATIFGEEPAFISRSGGDITFVTNPFDLGDCPSPSLVLSDIDASNDATITSSDARRKRRSGSFSVDGSLTPTVTSLDPVRGGTAGGTQLTIGGTNFGTDMAAVQVTIAGSVCTISSLSATEIVCQTGAFNR